MNGTDYTFEKFLELPEDERFEFITGVRLYWWQKIEVRLINKWWSRWRSTCPRLRAIDLWESIYKNRF